MDRNTVSETSLDERETIGPGGRIRRLVFALSAFVLGALLVSACDSAATGPDGDTGTLTVLLTDAPFPFDLVESANVTISQVDVVTESGIETAMGVEEQSFNLLELQDGVTALLSSAEVEAGTIQQVRLVVSDAWVVMNDGREFDLNVPSGAQTGIKILTPGLEVEGDLEAVLTLDFDVEDSFVTLGNPDTAAGIHGFLFQPVIRPVGLGSGDEEGEENGENGEENGENGENGNGG